MAVLNESATFVTSSVLSIVTVSGMQVCDFLEIQGVEFDP
jgi:uncharacterized protein YcgI (DUF1989 family)